MKLFVDGVPKKCAPMRRSNVCHGLQSSVGFGPHMRRPASARLMRTLRGAYADAPLYNIKFGGCSSSRRRRSRVVVVVVVVVVVAGVVVVVVVVVVVGVVVVVVVGGVVVVVVVVCWFHRQAPGIVQGIFLGPLRTPIFEPNSDQVFGCSNRSRRWL